jgi:hypothetical protein
VAQETIDNVAQFDGVLVQRQYKPGQKYVQLVFETAEGLRLSLSRNADLIRSLTVGTAYRVSGEEYSIGNKSYIHEPLAAPIPSKRQFFQSRALIISAVLVVAVGATSGVFLLNHGTSKHQLEAQNVSSQTPPAAEPSAASQSPAAAAAATPTADTPATTASPAAVPSKATSVKRSVTTTPSPSPSAVPTPQPPVMPAVDPTPPPVAPPAAPPADPNPTENPDQGNANPDTNTDLPDKTGNNG